MIRVDFGPISETVYIDFILNTIIEKLFLNNREKIVDSNVKLRKRSGLSLLLNFS
jgi:hypothetical protein